jgi:hypothetical protein
MKKRKTASRLARAIDRFLTHKRTLGHHYRQESWLLQRLDCFVTESGRRDLDEKCFTRWLMSLQDRHPNTRRKWYQIVRHFCCYRRKREPGCFLPSADGVSRPQPYVMPVIVEPQQIARMIGIASKLSNTSASPLRGPTLRLAPSCSFTRAVYAWGNSCAYQWATLRNKALCSVSASRSSTSRVWSRCPGAPHVSFKPTWGNVGGHSPLIQTRLSCVTATVAAVISTAITDFSTRSTNSLKVRECGTSRASAPGCMIFGTASLCRRLYAGTKTEPTFKQQAGCAIGKETTQQDYAKLTRAKKGINR